MALPTIPPPPTGPTADEQARNEYLQALTDAMKSIENRGMFQMAGALFDPGKTGGFGEALGKASSAFGESQANIGQMRAQLASQKFTVAKEARDDEMLQRFLQNQTGQNLASNLQSGAPVPTNQLKQLSSLVSMLNPDTTAGKKAKQIFDMAISTHKEDIAQSEFDLKAQQYYQETGEYPAGYTPPSRPSDSTTTTTTSSQAPSVDLLKNSLGKDLVVSSGYGMRNGQMHGGIDFAGAEGTPVTAVTSGKVVSAGNVSGYGQAVVVENGDGTYSYYGHVKPSENVKVGSTIKAGTTVGTLLSKDEGGRTSGPHVEFGIRDSNNKAVNPLDYLAGKKDVLVASSDKYAGLKLTPKQKREETSKDIEFSRQQYSEDLKDTRKSLESSSSIIDSAKSRYTDGTILAKASTDHAKGFGLLRQNPGVAQAFANFLENGIQLGKFSASIPIEKTMRKNLPLETQNAIEMVESTLNNIAIDKATDMKGSVSNYEDQMVKSVYGTPENTAKFINYIGNRLRIEGKFKEDYQNAFYEANKKTGILKRDFDMTKGKELRDMYHDAVEHLAKSTLDSMRTR